MRHRTRSSSGVTLLEIVFSIGIFSLIAMAAFNYIGISWSFTNVNKDRIFAFRKAQFILSELQAYVDRGSQQEASDLDRFDNGSMTSPVLTITEVNDLPVSPDHPASMNRLDADQNWIWSRRITVRPILGLNSKDVRFVTVRMFKREKSGREAQLAEISSVIRSIGTAYPTTQVYDMYVLALENVPGWWVYMNTIRPFVLASMSDLESRNPGMKFRIHWITRLGYGRDPYYTPYTNDAYDSTVDQPSVYFYPGKMPDGSSSEHYYVPINLKGRKNVDGMIHEGFEDSPFPYSLADQWNHCMRLPEAKALFQRRVAVGLEDPLTPPWQILLDDMITYPQKYHNAIFVNLHGELLPMPPLRNYSDAAKDPENLPGARVVTHPEQIRYHNQGSRDIRLRVYAYKAAGTTCPVTELDTITVRIGGLTLPDEATVQGDLADPTSDKRPVLIESIENLTSVNSYVRMESTPAVSTIAGVMQSDQARVENGDLVLTLRHTPLDCPPAADGSGLDTQWQLYGQDYIPSPTGSSAVSVVWDDETTTLDDKTDSDDEQFVTDLFAKDLTSTDAGPKNTARWIITIRQARPLKKTYLPQNADRLITVTTCMGSTPGNALPRINNWPLIQKPILGNPDWDKMVRLNPLNNIWEFGYEWQPSTMYSPMLVQPTWFSHPSNRSTTFVYWTDSREDVPFTERFQYQGDPRHCPYADLRENAASFPHGFNWFFDNMSDTNGTFAANWGFTDGRLADGWMGRLDVDVARLMQTIRTAMVKSETLYSTLTGWSYYYVGIGNEIGYDASNGYDFSIPVNGRPYGLTGTVQVDTISAINGDANLNGNKLIQESAGAGSWWGMPWLGELYPDHEFSMWSMTGNLPAGDMAGTFKRVRREDITWGLPQGTTFVPTNRKTQAEGCTSFFNIGTATATFHHQATNNRTGTLTTNGQELASNYNFSIPTTAKISRPFNIGLDKSGGIGPEFNYPSEFPRFTAQVLKVYYDHEFNTLIGSALVELKHPTEPRSAYVVVNGLDKTLSSGSAFIGKYSILSLVQSMFEAGNGNLARPVARLPRAVITSPTSATEIIDPASIEIRWETRWERWNSQPYTTNDVANTAEAESNLVYALLYSRDGGETWLNLLDDSQATLGVRPPAALTLADQGTGPEVFVWSTPKASMPGGSYLIRIEAFRNGEDLHYAHHTEKIYIERT